MRRISLMPCLLVLAMIGSVHAQSAFKPAQGSGAVTVGGLTFSIIHFSSDWQMSNQSSDFKADAGFPKTAGGTWEISGQLATKGGAALSLREVLDTSDRQKLGYEATLANPQGVQTNTIALAANLPIDNFAGREMGADGQAVKFPEKFSQMGIFNRNGIKKLEIPSLDGSGRITIEGSFAVSLQDDRQFGSESFSLRLSFNPASGLIKQSTLKLAMSYAQVGPPIDTSVTIVEGPDWRPIRQKLDVEKGSILDFSNLVDAPAGKSGNVVVKGEHFEFANRPGKPVRFYGANLCFSANFPTKEQAERLAERLTRIGYNCVRIHHYDGELADRNAANSATLNPAQLDRLDYFVSCLKKNGLYINIDLYTIRQIKAAEIPELNRPIYLDSFKAVVPLLDSAMANWQQFAKNLLTHKNPYTGMTWAEDPVLVGICPLNEDPLPNVWGRDADIKKLYEQRFEQWLTEQKLAPKDANDRSVALTRFLVDLQIKANRKEFAFLKSIGVKAPLTSVNCIDSMALAPIRNEEEYVDNHAYWDHPSFPERPWGLPHVYGNKSALAAGARVPRTMMPTRIVGKPFTCTEFNFCFPNRWRAESGPLFGAYAALQDWDGLYRFAYSHANGNLFAVQAGSGFDLVTQPLDLMSERIGLLMFLRGDVKPSEKQIAYALNPQSAVAGGAGWGKGYFPEAFSCLGLRRRIGSIYVWRTVQSVPAIPLPSSEAESRKLAEDNGVDVQKKRAVSDTGQITIAGDEGTFRVITERSECFVMADARQMQGRSVSVRGSGGQCVAFLASMDGKNLTDSGRILVIHLTDVQNTNIRYRNKAMTIMEQWGRLPQLVRAGKAAIRMELHGPGEPKCFAIDLSGARGDAVELKRDGDAWTLEADTARGCLAYEIVR